MKNRFYKYVKNLTTIPCSGYFQLGQLYINEDQLITHINLKYKMDLINFEKSSDYNYSSHKLRESEDNKVLGICDKITYHFKINNILYLEYKVINTNLLKSNDYTLVDLIIYSSLTNQKDLILFLEYISDYVNNKNKNKL